MSELAAAEVEKRPRRLVGRGRPPISVTLAALVVLVVAVAALVAYPASTGPVMYARMRGWLPHAETHPYCQGGSRLAGWFGLWDESVAYQFWWAERGLNDRQSASE